MKAETLSGPAGLAEVRRFVDLEIAPHANTFERAEWIPREVLSRVAELGLWAPFLPSEFGGGAMDMVTLGRVHEEIGRGCSSLRSLLTVHSMVSASVHRWGDQAQQEKWLRALARGEKLGAFCLTEPDRSGSDATAEGTTAVRDQDGWVLNGTKKWITGGQVADLFMVFATTGSGMCTFLVEADRPGVRVTALPHVSGTTASMLALVEFTDVRLEPSALLGPQGWAAGTVMTNALGLGRYSVACGAVGIIRAAIEACAQYTSVRTAGGVPLRDLPHVRQMMSGMVTARDAGRLLCERAGALNDAGDPATIMATWVAKYHASKAAVQAAGDAVQIHGANGFSPDYPVARLYRDSKVTEVIEGSTQVQELTIAAEAYREVAQ
jgi:alkylation response protein AidB-like acyl-CoA dehydrogenase